MTMDIDQGFLQAVADSKTLSSKPSTETLLKLYSFYKQATEGDINAPEPGAFDFVAKAKYEAWASLKGKSKDEAKKEYIDLIHKLKE
jgi:diazepam-binding inhibitor (GABA receptor modulator, acyl-CoA-binding protein)